MEVVISDKDFKPKKINRKVSNTWHHFKQHASLSQHSLPFLNQTFWLFPIKLNYIRFHNSY